MRKFEDGSLLSHLMFLSWPMVFANLFQNGIALFEVFLLGKLGVAELAAFTIGSSILLLFWSLNGGMLTGSIAMVSRLNGEGKYKRMNRAIVQMLFSNMLMTVTFIVVTFIFLDPLLKFFGAEGETIELARRYTKYIFMALPFVGITFTAVVCLRAIGDSITPLKMVMSMVAANAIAAPLFIFGWGPVPAFGIAGVALGTLSNFVTGAVFGLFLMFRGAHHIRIKPHYIKPDFELMWSFLKLAFPALGQGLIPNVANMVLIRIMSVYGDAYIAAFGVFSKLIIVVMMFGWPIGNSGGILVGYHLGRKILNRVLETVRTSMVTYTWITAFFAVIFFIFAENVLGVLTDDAEVIRYGVYFLRIITPVFVVMGLALVVHAAFNGAGSTHLPTIINLFAFVFVQLILAYYLPKIKFFGLYGIPVAILATYMVQGFITFIIYKKGKWIKENI